MKKINKALNVKIDRLYDKIFPQSEDEHLNEILEENGFGLYNDD